MDNKKAAPTTAAKKAAYKARQAELARMEAQRREEERKSLPVALPRTYTTHAHGAWNGSLGHTYVRNDGNKHIKSVGDKC